MFLLPWFGRSNLRRMADLAFDAQLLHQAQKPLHRSRCFDPYAHRARQRRIKLLHVGAAVRQGLLHHLPCRGIEHRQRLLASVQVTSYNSHLGLLRSEHCWGEHRTVYSDRREADVVMTSIGHWKRVCFVDEKQGPAADTAHAATAFSYFRYGTGI